MPSYTQSVAALDPEWIWIVRIEGVGLALSAANLTRANNDGRIRFCQRVPAYVEADALYPAGIWEDLMKGLPDPMGERPDPLGGATEYGSFSLELVDADNTLTQLLRTERGALTRLTADVTSSATTLTVGSTSGITAPALVYVGSEAMLVSAVPSGTTLTVSRGYLDTTALPHRNRDSVFDYIHYLRGRRVDLHIGVSGGSASDEREVGTYVLDDLSFSEAMNCWVLQGVTQLKPLNRSIPQQRRSLIVENLQDEGKQIVYRQRDGESAPRFTWTGRSDATYLRHPNGEVFSARGFNVVADGQLNEVYELERRDLLRNGQSRIEIGDRLHQVFLAEYDIFGSFRYSPGPSPSTDRRTGTWTSTAHWVPLTLILMLSSADPDDGLELTNYVAARGNFASLPVGFGVGYPASRVDWDSWFDAWHRTADMLFPYFVFGHEEVEFGELITENFLRPMGAYFVTSSGNVQIVLPRIPFASGVSFTIGPEHILTRKVGKNRFEPRIEVARDSATQTSAIKYIVGPSEETFSSADFADTFGQRGYYGTQERPIEITIPGGDPEAIDRYARRGQSRLWRTSRPRLELRGDFTQEVWDGLEVGENASITVDEVPNLNLGTRGWTDFTVQQVERGPRNEEDGGLYVESRMIAYGPAVRAGRIAPSAIVSSVTNTTATVTANRFTHSDAVGGLPTTDAADFAVGDVLALVNLDGTDAASSTTQTIVSISGNDIDLDGDFGANLAANLLLIYVDYDQAASQQQQDRAFMADAAALTVGAAGPAPFNFGEP